MLLAADLFPWPILVAPLVIAVAAVSSIWRRGRSEALLKR